MTKIEAKNQLHVWLVMNIRIELFLRGRDQTEVKEIIQATIFFCILKFRKHEGTTSYSDIISREHPSN